MKKTKVAKLNKALRNVEMNTNEGSDCSVCKKNATNEGSAQEINTALVIRSCPAMISPNSSSVGFIPKTRRACLGPWRRRRVWNEDPPGGSPCVRVCFCILLKTSK